jgi:hypothetical protein
VGKSEHLKNQCCGAGAKESKLKKRKEKNQAPVIAREEKGVLGTIRFQYRTFICFSGLRLGMWRSVFSRMIGNARLKMVSVKLNLLQLENDKIIKRKIQKC